MLGGISCFESGAMMKVMRYLHRESLGKVKDFNLAILLKMCSFKDAHVGFDKINRLFYSRF